MAVESTIVEIFSVIKFILIWFWWAIVLGWLFLLKFLYKKFPIECVIIEKRGNNLIKTNDRAGRYVDPYTQLTGYKLMKAKDTIPVIGYDWVLHNNYQATNIFDRLVKFLRPEMGTIFLFRYGSKQYKPLMIKDKTEGMPIKYQEVKDEQGNSIWVNVYQQFDPRDKLGALDFEVVDWDNMNFMVQEQRASIERRKKKSEFWLSIAIPAIIIAGAVIFSIVMIKYGYDYGVSMKSGVSTAAPADKPAEVPNIPIISDAMPGD